MTQAAEDGVAVEVEPAQAWNCEGCKYDLSRVPATKDPHYGFLIVTCPECGGVAPYAVAARKRDRGGAFATFWRLVWAAVLIFGCAGALGGLAQSTGYAASVPLAESIAGVQPLSRLTSRPVWSGLYTRVRLHPGGEPVVAVSLKEAGGWRGGVAWPVLTDLWWYIPITVGFTAQWALSWRRMTTKKLVRLAWFVSGVAGVGLVVYYCDSMGRYGWEWAITLAEWKVGVWIAAGSWMVGAAMLVLAARVARSIARFVVLVFVPPVFWVGMRELWTADGLAMPVE